MSDCANVEVRELLPELVHGSLAPGDRARVEAHVQGCAACAAELRLLRAAHRELRRPVAVDVARIVAALPPAPSRATPRVAPSGHRPAALAARRSWMRVAAAALLVAGGAAGAVAVRSARQTTSAPVAAGATADSVSGRELLVASGAAELDEAGLESLLAEIESLDAADALPSAEPPAVVPVLLDEEGV